MTYEYSSYFQGAQKTIFGRLDPQSNISGLIFVIALAA